MDYNTGEVTGTISTSSYPSVQVFVDGQPVYNYEESRNMIAGPIGLFLQQTQQFKANLNDGTNVQPIGNNPSSLLVFQSENSSR